MLKKISLTVLLLCPFILKAEESGPLGFGQSQFFEEIETDRPDATEGTATVEPGHLQLEGGYTFTYDKESGNATREHSLPEFLLRLGLLEDIELRIEWAGYQRSLESLKDAPDTDEDGLNDLVVGFKQTLSDAGSEFAYGYLIMLELPTSDRTFGSEEVVPEFRLLGATDLTEEVSLGANLAFAVPRYESEDYLETSSTLTIAYALTEEIGHYLEYFGSYPSSNVELEDGHYFNTGLTYLVKPDLQLDIRVGTALNSAADDMFCGLGFAWRM